MEACAESYAGPSVLQKVQRNVAVLFRQRFTTLWRNEIRIDLLIDADSLNRRRRRFYVQRTVVYYIYQGQWRQYAGRCACVYDKRSVKNKIEKETNLTERTSNLT
jgi:hypothetical protein